VRYAAAVFSGFEAKRGHANAVGVESLLGFVDLKHVAVSPMGYKPHPLVSDSPKVQGGVVWRQNGLCGCTCFVCVYVCVCDCVCVSVCLCHELRFRMCTCPHVLFTHARGQGEDSCLVVPLGFWPAERGRNVPYDTIMKQNARFQVTSGANTGDMAWHHVVSCSMKQLHMLTFQATRCESKTEQVRFQMCGPFPLYACV
jgi:hypothetical protein